MNKKTERENKKAIPVIKIQRYLLGELPEGELEKFRALERGDEGARGRIAEVRALNEAILAKYPPAEMAAKYMESRPKKMGFRLFLRERARFREAFNSLNWKNFSRWAVPAFACAAALIYLPLRALPPAAAIKTPDAAVGPEAEGVRVKGLAQNLEVWRKLDEGAEELAPETPARAGDVVLLRYVVPEPCYGALVSIDGRGVLTVHLAGELGKAAPLTPGRPVALGSAYKLDDAPRFETFYLITSPEKFDVNAVSESLKSGVKMLGKRQVTEFTLLKGA